MPSGGARARSGPAPDPGALRRTRDAKEWVKLAANARVGKPTPPWPLDPPIEQQARLDYMAEQVAETRDRWAAAEDGRTARTLAKQLAREEEALKIAAAVEAKREEAEQRLWTRLWTYPQAVVWEADFQHLNVAMYVRTFLEAARPEAKGVDRTVTRQYADILLLTEPSLHAHKYVIDSSIDGASDPDLVATTRGLNTPDTETTKPAGRKSRFTVVKDEEPDAS